MKCFYLSVIPCRVRRLKVGISSRTNGVEPWHYFLEKRNKHWARPQPLNGGFSLYWIIIPPEDSRGKRRGSWRDLPLGRWAAAHWHDRSSLAERWRSGLWWGSQLWALWPPKTHKHHSELVPIQLLLIGMLINIFKLECLCYLHDLWPMLAHTFCFLSG